MQWHLWDIYDIHRLFRENGEVIDHDSSSKLRAGYPIARYYRTNKATDENERRTTGG